MFRWGSLVFILLFAGVLQSGQVTAQSCIEQTVTCALALADLSSLTQLCSATSDIRECIDGLEDVCDETNPADNIGGALIKYYRGICSPQGIANATAWALCGIDQDYPECKPQQRSPTPESCTAAQKYVDCVNKECGADAAWFALTQDQLQFDLQGGSCQLKVVGNGTSIPQGTNCVGQIQVCGVAFGNQESATSVDAVCGASSPLKQCIDVLEKECASSSDPFHIIGNRMVQFHKYLCSSQGQADVAAWASCRGPNNTCDKQARTTTEESCNAAKAYVTCVKEKCNASAERYVRKQEAFEIEVQGGVCQLSGDNGTATTCVQQLETCGNVFTAAGDSDSGFCGMSSPARECTRKLEKICQHPYDKAYLPAQKMVAFHRYACSQKGLAGATYALACGASEKCGKEPRSPTPESCSAAQMYVNCVKEKCGALAAEYALTLDQFEIEVQGTSCPLQEPGSILSTQNFTCSEQFGPCIGILSAARFATSHEEFCSATSPLVMCTNRLKEKCQDPTSPLHYASNRVIKYHEYICSQKGRTGSLFSSACGAELKCGKQARNSSMGSCTAAQSYVNCVQTKCGREAAGYALTVDKFEIEVQGGICPLQLLNTTTRSMGPSCGEYVQTCGAFLDATENATTVDEICGTDAPVKICGEVLENKCDQSDPAYRFSSKMVSFIKYICSEKGQADIIELVLCEPDHTCTQLQQDRVATMESCNTAKMYVKCIKDQCGQEAADYALTLDKFTIEIQGGTCDFQESTDPVEPRENSAVSNGGMTMTVFLASLVTALL